MKKWEGRPFVIVGVNIVGHKPKELKAVMEKAMLPWRSFTDTGPIGKGPIATQWNFPPTPTFYVLDAKGIIRYKWAGSPGEKVMDRALEKLILETEGIGKP